MHWIEWVSRPEAWVGLLTLTLLEVVLGIDNLVFISILAGKLPPEQQGRARKIGLLLAMGTRILLLFALSWLIGLVKPLFTISGHGFSGRDLILIAGGLFLIAKSTREIHERLEGEEGHAAGHVVHSFAGVIFQIMLLDIVFSLDSVITAVGMVGELPVMVLAIVIAVVVMILTSDVTSKFIERHPTVKMLALSFLLLIGFTLLSEGVHFHNFHIPKGYVYFAMGFSVLVEMLNLRVAARRKTKPVRLHQPYVPAPDNKAGAP